MEATTEEISLAVCVAAGSEDDLEVGRVYPVLPDAPASELGCLRVIDESGEDYLYAANRFVVVDVPHPARGRLLKAVTGRST